MRSLKTKLLLFFSILLLFMVCTTTFQSIFTAKKLLSETANETVKLLVDEGSKLVESRMTSLITELQTLANQKDMKSMDISAQMSVLRNQMQYSEYKEMAMVDSNGYAHYTDGSSMKIDDLDYIKKAKNGVANISDIQVNAVSGELSFIVAVPIKDGNAVVGVLLGEIDGNTLSNITSDMGYGTKGYAYIFNNEGQIVAHRNKQLVLDQTNVIIEAQDDPASKSLAEATEYMLATGSGVTSYNYNGNEVYAAYKKIIGTNWFIVVTANTNEVLSSVVELREKVIIASIISGLVGIVLVYLIGHFIAKPINTLAKISEKIAMLDITQKIPEKYLKYKDENGLLAKAMDSITVNLRAIIGEITESALQVASTAEELTATAEQSASASEEVSRTVEEIAKGASEQAANTEKGSTQAIRLGEIIEMNGECLLNMNEASKRIAGVVNDGLKEIDRLEEISMESSQATKEIYDIIQKTNESANQISEASNVISSIADQTKLLALNASIEAARAGEAGKGFSVVADEIKKLAGQSAASTGYIDNIISELQTVVAKAVESIEKVNAISVEQSESVQNTKTKYEDIMGAVSESEDKMEQLNTSEKEMLQAKDDILDMLQTLSAIAEENAASTEEASAAMVEQSASMDEIAKSSERLSDLATGLQNIIQRFEL